MSKKLSIYLGDMAHNFVPSRDIWTIPLNICCIASYVNSFYEDEVEFRLFKFPDLLLNAIDNEPPDIIGLSNYVWNTELSKKIIKFAKKADSRTVAVMGGPNVTQTEDKMTRFMNECSLDYYVSLYGEDPFKCIVEAMLKQDSCREALYMDPAIHGVWYLDRHSQKAVEKRLEHTIKDLDMIPSPFTSGLVDEFFDRGLMPMIETQRGCPYHCTYCDWGSAGLGKITKYSLERVKKDIAYCHRYSQDERLMINDANFGILGKRDLAIAEYLKELKEKIDYPGKLIITWSQTKSEAVLKIADALKSMLMVTTSFQSMNEEVLKNIKRQNISHEHFTKIINFCKEKQIDTYGELMLALPGETLESHFNAIRYLFNIKVDFININPLMLLEGALLCDTEERLKYDLRTKWRLLENCYGVYDKSPVIEYQEMVVQTNTLAEKDYLLCRPISWLIQMSWNLKRHEVLMKYVQSLGLNPLDFILKAIRNYRKSHHKVASIFEDFLTDTKTELFDTEEELINHYSQPMQLDMLRQGGFRKLNTHYTSRVSLECNEEFVEYYKNIAMEFINEKGMAPVEHEDKINDCSKFMFNRYVSYNDLARLTEGENIDKELSFQYDILGWLNDNDKPLQEFYCPGKIDYVFDVDSEQKRILLEYLERFRGLSSEYQMRKLQEPYHGIHKKHLLYNIIPIRANK